jgi:lipopolysaccharide transport protein LptA
MRMCAVPPPLRAEPRTLRAAALLWLLLPAVLTGMLMPGPAARAASAAADSIEGSDSVANCHKPLCWQGSSLAFDLQSNHLEVPDFEMVDTARNAHIKADRAERSGEKVDSSTWVLTGHVQITVPQGQLSADQATMQVSNNHIVTMTAQGAPAQFERGAQSVPPGVSSGAASAIAASAHGHAREIVYDLDRNELQLNGDAWLTDGCYYELHSQHISYDIANQKVHADPSDGTGVQGSVAPKQRPAAGCPAESNRS